ncbi:hypothetical protein F7725_017431 [Dissostichus mawsoni]|uniref:Copine C-terminal domain-containing protein n=1 Tax=Dissostichus mawsoni TaxID=36200 RepID=A0A7J5Z8N9_DISMA|nr:hypothetical protein F7725_017431 [Dissostichus mawsoni]
MDECVTLQVGVDFTGSNGDPRSPNSLHYMSQDGLNQYLSALWSVGNVVQDYDTDKLFPAFGFGAKLPPDYQTANHEFALNFNPANPFCQGVQGIVEAYRMVLPQLRLSGPTNFSPLINHVAGIASQAAQSNNAAQYFVLLILTDGEITDFDQTKDAIVRASRLPLSVIIAPQASLAQSVLAEVPNQLVSYFKMRGFDPPKPPAKAAAPKS